MSAAGYAITAISILFLTYGMQFTINILTLISRYHEPLLSKERIFVYPPRHRHGDITPLYMFYLKSFNYLYALGIYTLGSQNS